VTLSYKSTYSLKKLLSWQLIERFMTLGLVFIVSAKTANTYGAFYFGEYSFIISIVSLTAIFQEVISKKVVIKLFIESEGDARFIKTAFTAKLLIFVFLFVIYTLLYYLFLPSFTLLFLSLIFINEVSKLLAYPFEIVCESNMHFDTITKVNVISGVLLFVSQFTSVYHGLNIEFLVVLSIVVNVFRTFLFRMISSQYIPLTLSIDKLVLYEYVAKSKYLCISFIYYITYLEIDKVMSGLLLDKETVAIYAIANQFIVAISIIIPIFQKTIYPILTRNPDKLEGNFLRYNGIITWVYIIIIPPSIYILNFVFPYVYDDSYQNATVLYSILAVGVLLAANSSLRVSYMVIEGQTKILMYVAIFGTIVNIVLNYIFILSFGYIGAAIATVITQLITSNLIYMTLKDYRKIPLLQIKSVFFFL